MKKLLLVLIAFAVVFAGCAGESVDDGKKENQKGVFLKVINHTKYDMLNVMYLSVELGNINVGAYNTKSVDVNSNDFIYFELAINNKNIRFRTANRIDCNEGAIVQELNNDFVVRAVDSNITDTIEKIYITLSKPIFELSQNNKIISNNTPLPFDFGDVELSANKQFIFYIKNSGNLPLELNGTPLILSSNVVFSIPSQPTSTSINPGASIAFLIQFTPTAEQEDSGIITIFNNSDDTAFVLNVKGTGYVKKPQIELKQASSVINNHGEFNFTSVTIGEPKDVIFTIGNTGDVNLTFEVMNDKRVNLNNNEGDLFAVTTQPSAAVTPAGTTNFTVRFNPVSAGNNFSAVVIIKSNSRNNDEFSFTVKGSSALAVPGGVTAVFEDPKSIVLSWNPVLSATGYKVYYGTSNSTINIIAVSSITETTYTHTGLQDGTTYHYCITAQDGGIESNRSQSVSRITKPGIPSNLRTTLVSYNNVTLEWNSVTGAASYRIYNAATIDGPKTQVGTVTSLNFNNNVGLSANTIYYYFVSAVNASGESLQSEALNVRTLLTPLSAPSNVTAAALSTSSIQITWGTVSGAVSYKVYRSTTATGTKTSLDTVTTTSYTSGGLEARTYWYFITSINIDGVESAFSAFSSMIPMPAIPTGINAYGMDYQVANRINWNSVAGAQGYRIYYSTSLTGTKTFDGESSSTSYYHAGTANTTYYYWIKAFNAAGESDYSLYTSALTPPAAPMNLRVTAKTTTSVTIAWNAVAGASYYYIEGVTPPTQTQTSMTVSGCSPKTWYTYYVRAYNKDGVCGPESGIDVQTN